MKSGDIAAVSALDQEIFLDPWPQEAYIQEVLLTPDTYYFVLESNPPQSTCKWLWRKKRCIYGFVGLRATLDQGHISTLAVRPDWRGQSFGELLLITVLKKALDIGLTGVVLEVRASNHVAQSLYSKYGFQTAERKSHYYHNGEDALLLYADITGTRYRQLLVVQRQSLHEKQSRGSND
ncbi:MAG: ribosomal protein S18-alanine N-acetyltransferase [Chloroflexota bacterium]|nr:ribosomal protein S18-alanine N-acetyltransferase [Chloroflexota bacterium]